MSTTSPRRCVGSGTRSATRRGASHGRTAPASRTCAPTSRCDDTTTAPCRPRSPASASPPSVGARHTSWSRSSKCWRSWSDSRGCSDGSGESATSIAFDESSDLLRRRTGSCSASAGRIGDPDHGHAAERSIVRSRPRSLSPGAGMDCARINSAHDDLARGPRWPRTYAPAPKRSGGTCRFSSIFRAEASHRPMAWPRGRSYPPAPRQPRRGGHPARAWPP